MKPKVSVILSVYNGGKYIKAAVESILNQTYKDFELIIIDDGSTDSTASILDNFQDSRVIRITNEKNLGLVSSLNKGLTLARGEYIARMDADDLSTENRLEKQMAFLENYKEIGVLGTAMEEADENMNKISYFQPPVTHKEILWQMLFGTSIAHATVVMRKSAIEEAGGYNERFPHVEDKELWSRLIQKTQFANLSEVLYRRRLHGSSIMSKHSRFQVAEDRKIRLALLNTIAKSKIFTAEEMNQAQGMINKENSFFQRLKNQLKVILPVTLRHKIKSRLRI